MELQRCAQCGNDNPAGAVFCGNCGAQLRSSAFDRPSGPVQLDHAGQPAGASQQPMGSQALPGAAMHDQPASGQEWPETSTQPHQYSAPAPPLQQQTPPAPPPPVNTPGAGLSPGYSDPPPPGWQEPGQPQQGYSQQPYAPPVYPGAVNQQTFYPPAPPPGTNTSGMGEGYPLPPETSGWNWGGFVPYGLFSFYNGSSTWGAIGLVAGFLGFYLVYSIIMGATGKQLAWKNRRFESVQQFEETMKAWNTWGLFLFIAGVVATVIIIIAYIGLIVMAINEGM